MIRVLTRRINEYYKTQQGLANLASECIQLILRNQVVRRCKNLYISHGGIATGLACGVFMANIYLDDHDNAMMENNDNSISNYFRFVDDVLLSAIDLTIFIRMKNWRPDSIKWEISAKTDENLPLLDLSLSLRDGIICNELYRKQLNAYLYLPASSSHPRSTKAGIASGETERIWRLCQSRETANKHLEFFIKKLCARGYDAGKMRNIVHSTIQRLQYGTKSCAQKRCA